MKKFSAVGAVLLAAIVVFGLCTLEIAPKQGVVADNVTEYKIMNALTTNGLSEKVNAEMKSGWKPTGGVFWGDNLTHYSQAMVKE